MTSQKVNTPFYLKYRPQRLDELLGQTAVKKSLQAAYENNKLSHAYIFVGPRGTGKTSTARILAKMVNCEFVRDSFIDSSKIDERSTMSDQQIPCNKCVTCESITDGSNLDLIEIDAASNRGIEDIRELRERIKLSPTSSPKKVYIIDEVHMLTNEAFNALLKTLEEPPAHALFILATTDVSKLPQTILSRVQRLDFKLASTSELTEALSNIIKLEKIDMDGEAIKLLVKRAEGSFRDGVKLLDQIHSIGGTITAKILEVSLNSTQFEELIKLLDAMTSGDAKITLLQLHEQLQIGVDAKNLTLSLMDLLRNIIFIKNGLGATLVEPLHMEDNYQQLVQISEKIELKKVISTLNILQKALEQLKFTSIPFLPLEVAVVEICEEKEQVVSQPVIATPNEVRGKQSSLDSEIASSKTPRNDNTHKPTESSVIEEVPVVAHVELSEASPSTDMQKLQEKWTYVLETVRPYNFSLEALLRSIKINDCTNEAVVMEVPYSFHQRILEAPKNREILESILSDILGRGIRITTVLGERPLKKEDLANIEVAQDDEIIRVAAEIFNSDSVN